MLREYGSPENDSAKQGISLSCLQVVYEPGLKSRALGNSASPSWYSGLLSTSWGAIDLDEPDLQLLIHHEVEAEELEALVWEVPGADGRLHA